MESMKGMEMNSRLTFGLPCTGTEAGERVSESGAGTPTVLGAAGGGCGRRVAEEFWGCSRQDNTALEPGKLTVSSDSMLIKCNSFDCFGLSCWVHERMNKKLLMGALFSVKC